MAGLNGPAHTFVRLANNSPGGVAGHAVQLALDPQERPVACYGGSTEQAFLAIVRGNAPKEPTVKIWSKDMAPFFVKGESDEP
jgi:hypothetical protein